MEPNHAHDLTCIGVNGNVPMASGIWNVDAHGADGQNRRKTMGATNFMTTAKGKSLDDAFRVATDQARFEYGHGGYTGTIAEKETVMEVRTMRVPPGTRKTT